MLNDIFTLTLSCITLATMQSWTIEYVGDASDSLYEHLQYYVDAGGDNIYANYTSIVQSSGMGKSRAVDQLSKTRLVVSLNLRQDEAGRFKTLYVSLFQYSYFKLGFPPADVNVR